MVSEEFNELVKEIKDNDKEFVITPRKLVNAFEFERRTKNNQRIINKFLEENQLEVVPDYVNTWVDGQIVLKHKEKATSKSQNDPVQRLKLLPAANKPPLTINRDAKLSEAVTAMMLNNYSQLPVMTTPTRVVGVISWETIGKGLANGQTSNDVKDYLSNDFAVLGQECPLLEAVATTIEKEFVLVSNIDNTLRGIVTRADISEQFLTLTEPFLILEQIELHIRQFFNGIFLVEEIQKMVSATDPDRKVSCIDDLTFGEYLRLLEEPTNWEKLNTTIHRETFIKQLHEVREIRNDLMHFDPEGLTVEQKDILRRVALFFTEIQKIYS